MSTGSKVIAQTDRQTDKQTTDRQRDRQRQTHTHTHTHTTKTLPLSHTQEVKRKKFDFL